MPNQHSQSSQPAPIAFIGGGNMARSLIGGLIARGTPAASIHVAEPVAELRASLVADFGVQVFADGSQAVVGADTWVLAVKPQVKRSVCETLSEQAQATAPLAISIAAGITVAQLQRWLGGKLPVVRAMPNTPALLGSGATGLFASAQVDADGRDRAQRLLETAGVTVWVDNEALVDAVTAASGSAPAYVFLLAEAMQDAAIAEGLAPDAALTLVLQTILGAARMLTEDDVEASELRRRVTSPNGTTQAAIETFEAGGLRELVARAMHAARIRGAELAAANE
jgi:pyrroline-5-carboxylate reductase